LRDLKVCETIASTAVDLCHAHACPRLLEVGPGKGAITLPIIRLLAEKFTHETRPELLLSERDRWIAEEWKKEELATGTLRVEEGDFLDLPWEKWGDRSPLGVVSNLPYSAGTAILTRLAGEAFNRTPIPFMVLMFQAEVAQRLYAQPSTKAYGSLSVWIQNRWDVTRLLNVPPGAFTPPPEVQSEVVVLKYRATPRVSVPATAEAEKTWERLLKACFSHRRKMLRSGLASSPAHRNALEASGVDGTKRAEVLTWNEWQALFEALRS
jgi:16S rRNA (adenine1518-N6/adenine1519-N6)-dimethyltransferase